MKRVVKESKVARAEERLKNNIWDIEAWSAILRDAQSKKIEDAREAFERIITQFPTAGQYWKIYISQELKAKNYDRVEKLFQRCLIKVLNIDLWKQYLHYIKDTKAKHPNYKEIMAQAFDFTIDKIGLDLNSYPIWAEYIAFLRAAQVQGTYAESQKITATRKVFQKAIVTPMIGIETLWRDYGSYEDAINPHIAKKLTDERIRDFTNARNVTKEYEIVTKGLARNIPSVPPQLTPLEVKQVELWKKYIQWEKDNPLKTEDITTLTKRVIFAYEQCLLCLGHHPDIWYEAASYLEQASKLLAGKGDLAMASHFADETASMYERGIHLLKSNMMLYFAYADYEEGRCKYAKVHTIYKKLISLENIDPTLPYIQYMRFARRCEGIMSARHVFKLAREDSRTGYQVYVSAALMEYFCSKDKSIGHRIFELGMKRFAGNSDFVLCYVDFMSHLNEDNNTRVLLERALGSSEIQGDKTRSIWSRFLQFELQVGDLASVQKIEKRRLKAFENMKEIQGRETALLVDRYRFLDLYPCSESELRSLGYRDLAKLSVTGVGGSFVPSVGSGFIGGDDNHQNSESGGAGASGSASGGGIGADGLDVPGLLGGVGGGLKQPTFPQPDVSQMLPFKPKAYAKTGSHPVPGGEFPPPPGVSALLHLLPPPECFHGPFVQLDRFLEHFVSLEIPDNFLAQIMAESEDVGIDPGTALSIEMSNMVPQQLLLAAARRRRYAHDDGGGAGGLLKRLRPSRAQTATTNAFGDSEDEGDDEDHDGVEGDEVGDDHHGESAATSGSRLSNITSGGVLDIFKLRQTKRSAAVHSAYPS